MFFVFVEIIAMDMPAELTALNITPQGALLRWIPPLSIVDNYVLTVTHNQRELSIISFQSLAVVPVKPQSERGLFILL